MRRWSIVFAASCAIGCEPPAVRLAPPADPEKVTFVEAGAVQRLGLGWNDICLLMSDGSVRCKQDWRPSGERRLGSFLPVEGVKTAVQIAAGHHHACARTKTGSVVCWGRNDSGEVAGDDLFVRSARTIALPAPANAVWVGESQSCARLENGALWCWGNVGQAKHAPPTELTWFAGALDLGLSFEAICAVTKGNRLQCSFAGGMRVEPLPGDTVVRQVVLGRFRGCALLDGGSVSCFSLSPPKDPKPNPWAEVVPELSSVAQLAAGTSHTCARRADGSAACWGDNRYGQLGDGSRQGTSTPTPVAHLKDATEIFAGGDRSCASTPRGIVCWGADLQGDAMYRALTGLMAEQAPPGPNDSLVPETLRVPTFTGTPASK